MTTRTLHAVLLTLGCALYSVAHAEAGESSPGAQAIVLVHGAFADGSGWRPVADILKDHGHTVYVVQEPETTFAADVEATRLVLERSGPCVLVGHSYGGMIISEIGAHPSVRSLVYVAAFQPDVGRVPGVFRSECLCPRRLLFRWAADSCK